MMSSAYVSLLPRTDQPGLPGGTLNELPLLSRANAEAILNGHRRGIYSFIRRKGFSAEEADDLTQETLIRAFLHLDGFRGVSLDAWLYRIAANLSVDHLRKRRVQTVPLDASTPVDGYEEDPLSRIDQDERRTVMMSVIDQLPECHRRVLRLRYYEDKSLAEIAGTLNCTPMAAKLRVFRAVSALRRRWHTTSHDGEMLAG